MPFRYILPALLAEVDDAAAVLFLDADGEMIESAVREPGRASTTMTRPMDIPMIGAYLGIHLRRTAAVTAGLRLGGPRLVRIGLERLEILAGTLADGYCLALVRWTGPGAGRATRRLLRAAADLERELLGETLS